MPRRVAKWIRDHPRSTGLALLLAVAVPGFLRVEAIQMEQGELVECVSSWGDEYTARVEYLAEPTAARQVALDRLIRAVSVGDETAFRSALAEYVEASDALEQARSDRPIPEPPRLQCNGG